MKLSHVDSDSETASESDLLEPATKRRRVNIDYEPRLTGNRIHDRAISPPPLRRAGSSQPESAAGASLPRKQPTVVASPIRLTSIRDLPDSDNTDTVTLHDIVGDASVTEIWHFNYLFDVDFVMLALHADVRHNIPVRIVHGFSGQNTAVRLNLLEAAARYPNVKLLTAGKLPAFGTHHSKMMIIFRDNNTAQVVIHTANMIVRDWTNLTQAAWISPILPVQDLEEPDDAIVAPIGTGHRFKTDLLAYLNFYEARTLDLVSKLQQYDFSTIRAALVASVPIDSRVQNPSWGWPRLREVIRIIPVSTAQRPIIVSQVSSIATLGKDDTWLRTFLSTLSGRRTTLMDSKKPAFRIIFPNANEIRHSLDGYDSGNSIHTKIQSAAQQKQLEYLRPMLCYWAGDLEQEPGGAETPNLRHAGRRRAAPHIKTYIRFANKEEDRIEWAMVTSANLSVQAWGGLAKDGIVRVSSYEIGVVLWPELFASDSNRDTSSAIMVPAFRSDITSVEAQEPASTVVGFRMPYDLPLVRYKSDDSPWCATSEYFEPDSKGEIWRHS